MTRRNVSNTAPTVELAVFLYRVNINTTKVKVTSSNSHAIALSHIKLDVHSFCTNVFWHLGMIYHLPAVTIWLGNDEMRDVLPFAFLHKWGSSSWNNLRLFITSAKSWHGNACHFYTEWAEVTFVNWNKQVQIKSNQLWRKKRCCSSGADIISRIPWQFIKLPHFIIISVIVTKMSPVTSIQSTIICA